MLSAQPLHNCVQCDRTLAHSGRCLLGIYRDGCSRPFHSSTARHSIDIKQQPARMPRSSGQKKNMFKKEHIPWNKGLQLADDTGVEMSIPSTSQMSIEVIPQASTSRMTPEEYAMIHKSERAESEQRSSSDSQGKSGEPRVLRPRKLHAPALQDEDTKPWLGMRLVHGEKMLQACNEAIQQHITGSTDCNQPNFAVIEEKKVGLCWKIIMQCTNCHFTTPEKKLYEEASSTRPGPRPATANIGLAMGLQDTPMGNTRCRTLLATMDVPPPARSSMQRTSNQVGEAVTQLNKQDMGEKLDKVKAFNRSHGNPESSINIAMDGRYNSTTISSRKKPGQNASQCIGIACETMTDKKYIVATATQNKLCWTGAWLRGQGFNVKCPGSHENCTANTHGYAPLSEYNLGKDIGHQLALQGAFVKYVTTDGDSKSASGVAEAISLLDPMWKVERLADPTHLGQAQFKRCYNAKFSAGMFPGHTLKTRTDQQKAFSQDVKARSSMVFQELMKLYAGNMPKIKKELPNVLRAMVLCYSGDCSMCRRHSYVCSGGVTTSWWNRSMFLSIHKLTSLCMTENDKHLLQEILKIKLSEASAEQMKLGTNTQKCEAVNRSISVSLPKNVNYSRNMEGRLASTVMRLNNGIADSTEKKLKTFGMQLSARSKKALRQIQHEDEYQREYATRPQTVKRSVMNRARQMTDHLSYKLTHSSGLHHAYSKGQLDPVPQSKGDNSGDHTYCVQ